MSAYSDLVASLSGAVAHWSLDETSGTAAVDVIGGNNGAYTGSYILGGKKARAGGPNGVDLTGGYVHLADSNVWNAGIGASGKMTWIVWMRPDTISLSAQMILTKYGQWQWRIESNGTVLLDFMDPSASSSYGSIANVGGLAATTDHMMMFRLDRDLAPDCTMGWNGNWTRGTCNVTALQDSTQALRFGARSDGLGSMFDGGMQDVSFFNRYLSDAELDNLYARGLSSAIRPGVIAG